MRRPQHDVVIHLLRLLLAAFCVTPAFATERIALVIGNGAYGHLPALANPANDARLMAETLEGAFEKFKVVEIGHYRIVGSF